MVQHARGRNDHIDGVGASVGGGEVPSAVHELGLIYCGTKHDALIHCVPLRDTLEVGLDFGTRRKAMAPLGVGLKRVAIEVRRHIAGDARIGVLAPRSAEALGLFVDDVVVEASFGQLDSAENARHTGANDRESKRALRHRAVGHVGSRFAVLNSTGATSL